MLDDLERGFGPRVRSPFCVSLHGRSNRVGNSLMTNQSGGKTTEQQSAAERIEEARRLNETIGNTLSVVLDLVQAGDFKDIDLLPKQMARLTDTIAEIRKKEAEFNDKFGKGLAEGDIDFDQLRREIGCRLGRIRRCCRS